MATTVGSCRRLEVELPITHNDVHFLGGYACRDKASERTGSQLPGRGHHGTAPVRQDDLARMAFPDKPYVSLRTPIPSGPLPRIPVGFCSGTRKEGRCSTRPSGSPNSFRTCSRIFNDGIAGPVTDGLLTGLANKFESARHSQSLVARVYFLQLPISFLCEAHFGADVQGVARAQPVFRRVLPAEFHAQGVGQGLLYGQYVQDLR